MTRRPFVASWAFVALGVGCAEQAPRALPTREPFIALERDFQNFEQWHQVDLSHRPVVSETHASGEAHEWASHLPPAGSKVFPVGTILVKTAKSTHKAEPGDKLAAPGLDIFAMVKRGGGYNQRGAQGWEWFELRRREDDSLGIVWRGVNPPNGEGYAGDPLGGCNGCHQMALKNDYVHATALTLTP
jgi:Cytochrome P460